MDTLDSIMKTLAVAGIAADEPTMLFQAGSRTMRVVVRNTGGNAVFLAHNANDLAGQNAAPSETFLLPSGGSETFVLQVGQQLLAAAQGAAGVVSIAVSQAMSKEWLSS